MTRVSYLLNMPLDDIPTNETRMFLVENDSPWTKQRFILRFLGQRTFVI